jgi:hypothetical protein
MRTLPMSERFAALKAARALTAPAVERTPAIRVWIATGTTPVVPAFGGREAGVVYSCAGGRS